MYKSASRNSQRRRAGDMRKYIKPHDSPIARFDRMHIRIVRTPVQDASIEPPSAGLEYTTCPVCECQLKVRNLSSHLQKVHYNQQASSPQKNSWIEILSQSTSSSYASAVSPPNSFISDEEFATARINVFYSRSSKGRADKVALELAKFGSNINLIDTSGSGSREHKGWIYYFPQSGGREIIGRRFAMALERIQAFQVKSVLLPEPPPIGYSIWVLT
jgi:hypothetical protein